MDKMSEPRLEQCNDLQSDATLYRLRVPSEWYANQSSAFWCRIWLTRWIIKLAWAEWKAP